MTIEEIKAYLEDKISALDKKINEIQAKDFNDDQYDYLYGEHYAYTDALHLLNDWNWK